jgi:DNA-binding transcriptional regulator GbsR (MarR family)
MPGKQPILPEVRELADQIGDFIQYWGFKKVHGRIWVHLLLSEKPLDAGELMRRLGISKALVSMSLTDLLKYEVVEASGKSEKGTHVYSINPDIPKVLQNVLRAREKKMMSRIVSAFKLLKEVPATSQRAHGIDREKLLFLGMLVQQGSKALDSFLHQFQFDLSAIETSKDKP